MGGESRRERAKMTQSTGNTGTQRRARWVGEYHRGEQQPRRCSQARERERMRLPRERWVSGGAQQSVTAQCISGCGGGAEERVLGMWLSGEMCAVQQTQQH